MKWWDYLLQVLSPAYGIGKAISGAGSVMKDWFDTQTGKKTEEAQRQANETNVMLTRETNAQAQYNLEHAHQIEVADLQAAGLNPWLSVGGGAQQANLQTAQVEAVDGSKMLQATTALMLLVAMKMLTPGSGKAASSMGIGKYLFNKM